MSGAFSNGSRRLWIRSKCEYIFRGTMKLETAIRNELADKWIPFVYDAKIRSMRTRSFEFAVPERENQPEILHTLMGIELKIGRSRFACPDLATARYLAVF